jgi:hypothetical protein
MNNTSSDEVDYEHYINIVNGTSLDDKKKSEFKIYANGLKLIPISNKTKNAILIGFVLGVLKEELDKLQTA